MKKELKAVIDTNITISAVIGKSATLKTIYNGFLNNRFTPILSISLQEELFNVIKKPHIRKLFRAREIKRSQGLIKVDAKLVFPAKKVSLCRDPKDNVILEAAVEAGADCIVTGDEDLLALKSCFNIPILTAHQFANKLNRP